MNERTPGMGDNVATPIDYFSDERDRLARDYGYLEESVTSLINESSLIASVDSQATKDAVKDLIKKFREKYKTLQGTHSPEKAPHLERGRATDAFFFGQMERISRGQKRTAKEGEADRLNRLLTDFDVRQEAEERERRRREAEEQARKLREAEEARIKAEQEAEAARLAAERARKPETQAAKEAVADVKAQEASAAAVEATVAHAKAEETYVGTLASSADIMRQRSDSGVLSTMSSEKFAEIIDRATLDLNALRPYIPLPALETALRKYAEGVGYSSDETVQLRGARFGKRPKSRVL